MLFNISDNHRITIREVAHDIVITFCSCQAIFMGILEMKRAAANIVPKLLNVEQKQRRIDIVQEMLMTYNYDFVKKVITGDESWVYGYDIDTKAPSYQ